MKTTFQKVIGYVARYHGTISLMLICASYIFLGMYLGGFFETPNR